MTATCQIGMTEPGLSFDSRILNEKEMAPFSPTKKTWAIILAAGKGSRLQSATGGCAKQFLPWQGVPLYWHSARTMQRACTIDGIVFVFPPEQMCEQEQILHSIREKEDFPLPCLITAGGERRQDSVCNGLAALPHTADWVLVHDSARPFATPQLIHRIQAALAQGAEAVIPGNPVTDTIKVVRDDIIVETLKRDTLAAIQTPQGFLREKLIAAHRKASGASIEVTDDASIMEAVGCTVKLVCGEPANTKITTAEDLALLTMPPSPSSTPCSGFGYDVHRYGDGRPLKVGGVSIPAEFGVLAHSDGDVLLHALMDAILGCSAAGDIGGHFPDNNPEYEGISSAILLDHVLDIATSKGVEITHVDLTVVAQKPKFSPFAQEIRNNVARLLGLDKTSVNFKATTEEGLGFTGSMEGIKAYALVSATQRRPIQQSGYNHHRSINSR